MELLRVAVTVPLKGLQSVDKLGHCWVDKKVYTMEYWWVEWKDCWRERQKDSLKVDLLVHRRVVCLVDKMVEKME